MKKNIIILLVVLFFANLGFSQEYIFKFKINNRSELNYLTKVVSIDNVKDNEIVAYANKDEFAKFKTLGYEFELLPHPSLGKSLTMATTVAQMADWDRYPTHDVYVEMMNQFATDYPDICRIETIGVSEAGRDVLVLKITDNPDVDEPEPEFFYTGQMHGDEIVTYIMFLKLADYLLSNYGSDDRIDNIINNVEIWINPLSNPDGTYAGGNNTVSGASRSNANGVDLNRNFPTPNLPNPSGVNEAEIQMMMDFADERNFVLSANSHSGIELFNYPWDTWLSTENIHVDNDWFYEIAWHYADAVHANAPANYFESYGGVTHGADWYIVDGSRQDYMVYYQNCRENTLELSDNKFLDCEDLPTYWSYNQEAMIGYIEECLYGIYGTVTSLEGEQIEATIEIEGHDEDNSQVVSELETGSYIRMIAPGTYDITYSAYGHESQTHSVNLVDYFQSTEQNVVLQKLQSYSLIGTVIEANTGNIIENATIEILNTPLEVQNSNADGIYSFNDVIEGTYDFKASFDGYASAVKEFTIASGENILNFQLHLSTSLNFEDGIPSGFTYGGNQDWTINTDNSYQGDYSMKSGNITDAQNTVMEYTTTTEAGEFSCFMKVSSESGWDFLKFYIDGDEKESLSGQIDWTEYSYNISAGSHTFKWDYIKDESKLGGNDCVWVDYITLPAETPASHQLTFQVKNGEDLVENTNVILTGYGSQLTNIDGETIFTNVFGTSNPGLAYEVSFEEKTVNGNIEVTADLIIPINLQLTDTHDIKLSLVKIYPNPSDGLFLVDFSHTKKVGILTVYDMTGKQISQQTTNQGFVNINLINQKSGVYFIKIEFENEIINSKIILQKN